MNKKMMPILILLRWQSLISETSAITKDQATRTLKDRRQTNSQSKSNLAIDKSQYPE